MSAASNSPSGSGTPPLAPIPVQWTRLLGADHDGYLTVDGVMWRVQRFLDKGSFGQVSIVARADDHDTVAAVKIPIDFSPGSPSMRRFERERRLMRDQAPRCLPAFLGEGTTHYREPNYPVSEIPFFLMELLIGETLAATIEKRLDTPTVAEAIAFGIDLTAAVRELHDRKILHRDLSDSNIWISGNRGVRLLDIGYASDPDTTDPSKTNQVIGTPQIVDPRLWRGIRPDVRSDLYAVGCNVLRFLTNQYPFPDGTETIAPGTIPAVEATGGGPGRDELVKLISQLFDPESRVGARAEELERGLMELAARYAVVTLDAGSRPIDPLIADPRQYQDVLSGIQMVFPRRSIAERPTDRELIAGATAVYKIGHLCCHAIHDLARDLLRWIKESLPRHQGTDPRQEASNALPALYTIMTRFEARTDLLHVCYKPMPELTGHIDSIRAELETVHKRMREYLTYQYDLIGNRNHEANLRKSDIFIRRSLEHVVTDWVRLKRLLRGWHRSLRRVSIVENR